MSSVLPRLRSGLDIMPSPVPDRPGLLVRDPFRYTETMLLIPPHWAVALACFDGQQTELDLQALLTRRTGQLVFSADVGKFVETLRSQGFLETEEFYEMRDRRQAEFREAAERRPVHAGAAYPEDAAGLQQTLAEYFRSSDSQPPAPGPRPPIALAAPHVSPMGGWNCYAAAYRRLGSELRDRTFVLLGTSHFGPPEKFGLTKKPYVTPLGAAEVDTALVDWLARRAPQAVILEDYCHAIEHSIEFQVVFLQYAMGAPVKIVPILCGPFAASLATEAPPESEDAVRSFFEALGEMAAAHGERLFWLLGIDLAHMGARYGDRFEATAGQGLMVEVSERDNERLARACAGDASGFFDLVKGNSDDLKWCGYPPLYTFLRSVPGLRGHVLRYEQWNIDPQSVVSFAGLEFLSPKV